MAPIDALTRLVAPPSVPVDGLGDWEIVRVRLGLGLPADFRALIEGYGVGHFGDITVFSPFDTHTGAADLIGRAHQLLETFRDHRDQWPEDFPYPLYPEPGGLLEWATTGNGDMLCWLTEGQPDTWPVVVWNIRAGARRYDVGVVEFLHGYLSGRLEVDLLGAPAARPWFDAYRTRTQVYLSLSEGNRAYPERLRILREVLAPTADRGGYDGGAEGRQDHFKVLDHDWMVTYENYYAHQIRLAYPPEHEHTAHRLIAGAVQAMGCQVIAVEGSPTWTTGAPPS